VIRGLNAYYVTSARNMPKGCGMFVFYAPTEEEARDLAFLHCPEGRWSFIYSSIEEVHPLDRKVLGIYVPPEFRLGVNVPDELALG
jgi:hypothetical protein